MGFLIINAIPTATINDLNSRFNMNLSRILISGRMGIEDYEDREFEAVKRFMESNTEVNYECNKY